MSMKEKIKEAILEYLKTSDTHPTAQEIFEIIKMKLEFVDKELFLEELVILEKDRKIACVVSVGNIKHYDIRLYKHYHFICKNCGVVRNVNINQGAIQLIIDHAQRLINSFAKITTINIGFQGICHNCRKENTNS